ncbi:hypothetical protein AAHC03_022912 [Spirometra sp. Aus1]
MIVDEEFTSASIDVPVCAENSELAISTADDGVSYACNHQRQTWIKIIKLETCNRSELSGILTFISHLQSLSPFRILSQETQEADRRALHNTKCCGVFLPQSICLKDTDLEIIFPFCPAGSACNILRPQSVDGGLPEVLVAAIFARAVRSLNELHSAGWLHRAICARHLLFCKVAEDSTELDVAFCGLGSMTPVRPFGSQACRNDLPILDACWRGWHYQNLLEQAFSTHPVAWYSPEVLAQDFSGYGTPSDVYSLGLTLGELFTGISPFVGTVSPSVIFLKKLCLKEPLILPSLPDRSPSPELQRIFNMCTHVNPRRRPTTEALLQEAWVTAGLRYNLTEDDLTPFR